VHASLTGHDDTAGMSQRHNTPEVDPELRNEVRAAGLRYVSDEQPGIARRRAGKGFGYLDPKGLRITDEDVLTRIRALAIPPAYVDVWICMSANGHLQATGRDARARKQYRYHERWRTMRDHGKFDRVLEFGDALPKLRRRVRSDLAQAGLPEDKVLALIVRLLDETLIRIGNDRYARDNKSFGLTTLRSHHVRTHRGRLRFEFRGKSGQQRELELDDKRLAKIIHTMQQLPGQRLFQYLDEEGKRQPVDSEMVNDYLRHGSGGEFTAKDFRTWGGTVQAAGVLARTPLPDKGGNRAMRSTLATAIKEVAAILGNTPAVCRASYIHPLIIAGWQDGSLQHVVSADAAHHPRQLEQLTLRYLRRRLRAGGRRSA
jgi:DNA topoisomerase-1